jgi:hypothetical protein
LAALEPCLAATAQDDALEVFELVLICLRMLLVVLLEMDFQSKYNPLLYYSLRDSLNRGIIIG